MTHRHLVRPTVEHIDSYRYALDAPWHRLGEPGTAVCGDRVNDQVGVRRVEALTRSEDGHPLAPLTGTLCAPCFEPLTRPFREDQARLSHEPA